MFIPVLQVGIEPDMSFLRFGKRLDQLDDLVELCGLFHKLICLSVSYMSVYTFYKSKIWVYLSQRIMWKKEVIYVLYL